MLRTAFVDDKLFAREFNSGDVVRKSGIRDLVLTPYVGRVIYSNADTGKIQVQWPWGVIEEVASELIHDTSGYFAPPSMDQSYSTWESSRNVNSPEVVKADEKWRNSLASSSSASRILAMYEAHTMPLYRAACKAWHYEIPEIDAYKRLVAAFGPQYGDDAVRITVANLYSLGRRLAIYWKNNKRRYKVTQKEQASGKICCPRCKGLMKPRVYRQGRKVLQCDGCGFSIHPKDLTRK